MKYITLMHLLYTIVPMNCKYLQYLVVMQHMLLEHQLVHHEDCTLHHPVVIIHLIDEHDNTYIHAHHY